MKRIAITVLAAAVLYDAGILNAENPPDPPPAHYTAAAIEALGDTIPSWYAEPLLAVRFADPFNDPILESVRGRLEIAEGDTIRLDLFADRDGDGRQGPEEAQLGYVIVPSPGRDREFVFPGLEIRPSDTPNLAFSAVKISKKQGGNVVVSFDSSAFSGEDTFFDFTGFRSDPIVTAVGREGIRAELPETFRFLQNYPNPFNPETRFRVALPGPGHVRLTVYDVLGRRVAVPADRRMEAGWHDVQWDGRDASGRPVPSGVYIAVAEFEGGRFTRKLQVLK
ncbi:MAG: FlgD immunoglobulin-like domain containing protein [bacterium]|nr:FlgD immunoglobulin-like domain containing protein [bacterium]